MVQASDAERGTIICSHIGCGKVNDLQRAFQYDKAIVNGLPSFGQLAYVGKPETVYPLQFGPNTIGTSDACVVRVNRFEHGGRCFISRQHCTLTISFDKWTGQLRYCLKDGAIDPDSQTLRFSLNGTLLNGKPLLKTEIIDVGNGDVITLGGTDRFHLTHAAINPAMLDTYKIDLAFNPDRTQ